jgi:hypothetical protein
MAPTCFSSSLSSSESLLYPPELLEIQIGWVVYHITCLYLTYVPDCRGCVCCLSQLNAYALSWVVQHISHISLATQAVQGPT